MKTIREHELILPNHKKIEEESSIMIDLDYSARSLIENEINLNDFNRRILDDEHILKICNESNLTIISKHVITKSLNKCKLSIKNSFI